MTEICPEIQCYENVVWNYLSDVFGYGLKASEIGLTNDLIYRIVSFYGGRFTGCEVYAFNDNVHEFRRGADIDLYIEDGASGLYFHFMLQAKIMDCTGRYRDIKPWSPNAQYNTLIRTAEEENAMPLYLLYNGETVNSNLGNDAYGLSFVRAGEIKDLRYGQRELARAPLITFNQLHPLGMSPFHVLFCDLPETYKPTKTFKREDVYTGFPYVDKTEPRQENPDNKNDFEEGISLQANQVISSKHLAKFRILLKSLNAAK